MKTTGSWWWLIQRLSGVALLLLIVVHFALMHYFGFEKRLYADVLRRLSNPLWKTFDLVFLSLGLYHGFYGLWGIVGDCCRSDRARIAFFILFAMSGLALYSLGLVTILSFRS